MDHVIVCTARSYIDIAVLGFGFGFATGFFGIGILAARIIALRKGKPKDK